MRSWLLYRPICLIAALSAGLAAASTALAHGYQHAPVVQHQGEHDHDHGGPAAGHSNVIPAGVAIDRADGADHAHPRWDGGRIVRNDFVLVATLSVAVPQFAPLVEATNTPYWLQSQFSSDRSTGPPPKLRAPPLTA